MKKMIFCVLLAALGIAPALMGNCGMKGCTCTNCKKECPKAEGCYTGKECTTCKHKSGKHRCTCSEKTGKTCKCCCGTKAKK